MVTSVATKVCCGDAVDTRHGCTDIRAAACPVVGMVPEHGHISHITLSTLEVTSKLHKSFVYSKYRNWELSWSCCGEAPAAGFAAGTGLGLARAVCLSPTMGRVTPTAAWRE